jgi:hypothetical protein
MNEESRDHARKTVLTGGVLPNAVSVVTCTRTKVRPDLAMSELGSRSEFRMMPAYTMS